METGLAAEYAAAAAPAHDPGATEDSAMQEATGDEDVMTDDKLKPISLAHVARATRPRGRAADSSRPPAKRQCRQRVGGCGRKRSASEAGLGETTAPVEGDGEVNEEEELIDPCNVCTLPTDPDNRKMTGTAQSPTYWHKPCFNSHNCLHQRSVPP